MILMRNPKSNDRRYVLGIDFSGAVTAGNRIWISTGQLNKNSLYINECFPGKDLPQSSKIRDVCYIALRRFIADQGECICGFDFPFGIPRSLVKEDNWEDFIINFSVYYDSPLTFKTKCNDAAGNNELKRKTDEETSTPFSPYNLRMFRQTYFGIKDILAPLVIDKMACVLPMQQPEQYKPWIIEICPASTLKNLNLYGGYKGNSRGARKNREHVLNEIEINGFAKVKEELWPIIIDNSGGDAIDSVIAAVAASRIIHDTALLTLRDEDYSIEGHVYV